ncbi:ATP-grasp domain-containing protein [Streptomyces rubiginosohelvolus]
MASGPGFLALAPQGSGTASLLSDAARRRGMEVTVLPADGVPERYRDREDGHYYGGPRFAARVAGPLGVALLEPHDGWLVAGLSRTVDGWLREPVDGQAVVRARAAAAGHRAEWRLRHLRCADEERAGLAAAVRSGTPLPPPRPPRLVPAAERTHWRDVRGALYLRPDAATDPAADTAPGQADLLLVHGEAASAREAYREQGSATPGDPHLLAGRLLAHTALHPGHRRLLARPERFAAAVEGAGPEVWEHAAHRLATPGSPV